MNQQNLFDNIASGILDQGMPSFIYVSPRKVVSQYKIIRIGDNTLYSPIGFIIPHGEYTPDMEKLDPWGILKMMGMSYPYIKRNSNMLFTLEIAHRNYPISFNKRKPSVNFNTFMYEKLINIARSFKLNQRVLKFKDNKQTYTPIPGRELTVQQLRINF